MCSDDLLQDERGADVAREIGPAMRTFYQEASSQLGTMVRERFVTTSLPSLTPTARRASSPASSRTIARKRPCWSATAPRRGRRCVRAGRAPRAGPCPDRPASPSRQLLAASQRKRDAELELEGARDRRLAMDRVAQDVGLASDALRELEDGFDTAIQGARRLIPPSAQVEASSGQVALAAHPTYAGFLLAATAEARRTATAVQLRTAGGE